MSWPERLRAPIRLPDVPNLGYPGVRLLAIVWTLVGTLAYARHYLLDASRSIDGSLLPEYLTWLTCYLPWIALSPLVFRAERRFPLGGGGWLRSLGMLAAISLPLVYAASAAMLVLSASIRLVFGPAGLPDLHWTISWRMVLGQQLLFWSSAAAAWMLRALLEARENERRAARLMLEKSQLEATLRQAELDALRMRLDPHFLFNALQNISVLTEHDPQTGRRMLTRLGDLLRVALRRNGTPETPLNAEIALTQAYLSVEQMRFGDRLSSLIDLAAGTERALVPTFLLQPLVENAIRHGLRDVRERGIIAVRSGIDNGSLVLVVTDNGAGPPAAALDGRHVGIGLGATRERLAHMYPGAHTFRMRGLPEGGTEVRITLPLRFDAVADALTDAQPAVADR